MEHIPDLVQLVQETDTQELPEDTPESMEHSQESMEDIQVEHMDPEELVQVLVQELEVEPVVQVPVDLLHPIHLTLAMVSLWPSTATQFI